MSSRRVATGGEPARRCRPVAVPPKHLLLATLGAALVAACTGGESRTPLATSDLQSCFPSVAQGRWDPSGPARNASIVGGASPSRGLALLGSQVLVYDHHQGRVSTFDGRGTLAHTFGRFGRGPGELAPVGATRVLAFPGTSWLAAAGDTVALFDGDVVHRYHIDGTFIDDLSAIREVVRGIEAFSSAIRLVPGGVLVDLEERVRFRAIGAREPRPYRLWEIGPERATVVAEISLPPLPLVRGAAYHGSGEARPSWSLVRDCFVLSDGSSAHVIVGRLGRAGLDTLEIPYAFRARPTGTADDQRLLRQLHTPLERIPNPSSPSRILRLATDEDGWIWLLPAQEARAGTGVQVVRFAPSLRRVEVDTVAFFPSAFGAPGIMYGVRRDSTGTDWLALARLR